ncbi:hypothetical protein HYFRA_00006956 [Hymenoscyphus fraxineus]|uniref:Uncharacterized protein n=1 Tax=Hymenoscyphus fraxineus TaxID=746836 RepID=A0A9N9KQV4_9HELO|nr:hypothetical protein HYFRA_00006956 [Hymenoscyphus fraxineus]
MSHQTPNTPNTPNTSLPPWTPHDSQILMAILPTTPLTPSLTTLISSMNNLSLSIHHTQTTLLGPLPIPEPYTTSQVSHIMETRLPELMKRFPLAHITCVHPKNGGESRFKVLWGRADDWLLMQAVKELGEVMGEGEGGFCGEKVAEWMTALAPGIGGGRRMYRADDVEEVWRMRGEELGGDGLGEWDWNWGCEQLIIEPDVSFTVTPNVFDVNLIGCVLDDEVYEPLPGSPVDQVVELCKYGSGDLDLSFENLSLVSQSVVDLWYWVLVQKLEVVALEEDEGEDEDADEDEESFATLQLIWHEKHSNLYTPPLVEYPNKSLGLLIPYFPGALKLTFNF